jgi:[ribosomal protein S5]-alanine N-acetyltransferase
VPTIRPLAEADARDLLARRLANRAFLAPFDPERPESFFTLATQREIARNPDGLRFAILDAGALAGTIALSNVSYGPFRSGNVGYWVSADRNGRGLATRAVGELVQRAFGELGLHRLEAGTLVDNSASQRVLARNGFERIGLARRYLHINGAWRDHLLFQHVDETA